MSIPTTEELRSNDSDLSYSEKFNAPDAEVVFQSSDGIRFRVHKTNLMTCKEGLSPPEHSTFDEVAILPESSSTLELLFQFIYPQPQPEIGEVDFEILALLAEAAEKYRVYPAMNLCTIYMMGHLEDHAEEILLHALKHGVHRLVVHAAPLLLDRPLEQFVRILPDCFVIPWVRYHTHWTNARQFAITSAPTSENLSRSPCSVCNKILHEYVLEIIVHLNVELYALRDLDAIFQVPACCPSATREAFESWHDEICSEVSLIPTLADIAFPGDTIALPQVSPQTLEANNSLGKILVPGGSPEPTSKPGAMDETYIKFLSSDGIAFYLCEGTIRAWTKNLLPSQYDEQVQLPEPSTTLETLFRFLQPSPHPDLEGCDFSVLGPLSLAADSYGVYPAMQVCRIRREQAFPDDILDRPSAIMGYAAESQDWELMDATAPFLIDESPVKMAELIRNRSMIILWFKYLEKWDQVLQTALSFSQSRKVSNYKSPYDTTVRRGCNGCKSCAGDTITIRIMRELGKGVKSLRNLDHTFPTMGPFCCNTEHEDIAAWREEVEIGIQGIPSFSSLLNSSDSESGDASEANEANEANEVNEANEANNASDDSDNDT